MDSSKIKEVKYKLKEAILEVKLSDGSIYHYFNVPEFMYNGYIHQGLNPLLLKLILKMSFNLKKHNQNNFFNLRQRRYFMQRSNLMSLTIHSAGYDNNNGILEIMFKNGKVYQYYNVPEDFYYELIKSSSPGKFFDEMIKGYYEYELVQ